MCECKKGEAIKGQYQNRNLESRWKIIFLRRSVAIIRLLASLLSKLGIAQDMISDFIAFQLFLPACPGVLSVMGE